MAYPERGADYKNRPAWLDRAIEGEKRADGGAVDDQKSATAAQMAPAHRVDSDRDMAPYNQSQPQTLSTLQNALTDFGNPYNRPSNSDKRGPRAKGGAVMRADGGAMTNARLAQVAPEFEPSAAEDARKSAAERTRRSADRLKTMNSPMKRMAASDPEL